MSLTTTQSRTDAMSSDGSSSSRGDEQQQRTSEEATAAEAAAAQQLQAADTQAGIHTHIYTAEIKSDPGAAAATAAATASTSAGGSMTTASPLQTAAQGAGQQQQQAQQQQLQEQQRRTIGGTFGPLFQRGRRMSDPLGLSRPFVQTPFVPFPHTPPQHMQEQRTPRYFSGEGRYQYQHPQFSSLSYGAQENPFAVQQQSVAQSPQTAFYNSGATSVDTTRSLQASGQEQQQIAATTTSFSNLALNRPPATGALDASQLKTGPPSPITEQQTIGGMTAREGAEALAGMQQQQAKEAQQQPLHRPSFPTPSVATSAFDRLVQAMKPPAQQPYIYDSAALERELNAAVEHARREATLKFPGAETTITELLDRYQRCIIRRIELTQQLKEIQRCALLELQTIEASESIRPVQRRDRLDTLLRVACETTIDRSIIPFETEYLTNQIEIDNIERQLNLQHEMQVSNEFRQLIQHALNPIDALVEWMANDRVLPNVVDNNIPANPPQDLAEIPARLRMIQQLPPLQTQYFIRAQQVPTGAAPVQPRWQDQDNPHEQSFLTPTVARTPAAIPNASHFYDGANIESRTSDYRQPFGSNVPLAQPMQHTPGLLTHILFSPELVRAPQSQPSIAQGAFGGGGAPGAPGGGGPWGGGGGGGAPPPPPPGPSYPSSLPLPGQPFGGAPSVPFFTTPLNAAAPPFSPITKDGGSTLDIDKAKKAPKLKKDASYETWVSQLSIFNVCYGTWEVVVRPSSHLRFPKRVSEMTPSERAVSFSSGVPISNASDAVRQNELFRCAFAYQGLMNAISDDTMATAIVSQVPAPNVHEAWVQLQNHKRPSTFYAQSGLHFELLGIAQKPKESIVEYSTRFISLVNRMIGNDMRPDQRQLVFQYIHGIKTLTQSKKDILRAQCTSVDAAVDQAQRYEFQDSLESQTKSYNATANTVETSGEKKPKQKKKPAGSKDSGKSKDKLLCHNCNKPGHFARDCKSPKKTGSGSKKGKPKGKPSAPTKPSGLAHTKGAVCDWCRTKGHTEDQCQKKRNGNPRALPADDESSDEENANFTSLVDLDDHRATAALSRVREQEVYHNFYLDSGASHHMATKSCTLANERVDHGRGISTAGSEVLQAPSLGDLALVAGTGHKFDLEGVYQHESLKKNLLSVSELLDDPSVKEVVINKTGAKVISNDGRVVLRADRERGLYRVTLIEVTEPQAMASRPIVQTQEALLQLHRRLGHIGKTMLQALSHAGAIPQQLKLKFDQKIECTPCIQGKLRKLSFARETPSKYLAKKRFERVHADLHGPVSEPSFDDCVYVLVIVDEYTGFTWATPLKSKEGITVFTAIQRWLKQIQNEYSITPVEFHTDRGSEFVQGRLVDYLQDQGVKVTVTMAYTPQHNGQVERMNQTLVNIARTTMIESHAPKSLWSLFIQAAAVINNFTHCPKNGAQTAQQLMHQLPEPPSIDFMHPLGCTAHAKVQPATTVKKYDSRTTKCALVGYLSPSGYKLMTPKLKIIETRHVAFLENDFSTMAEIRQELEPIEQDVDTDDESHLEEQAARNELQLFQQMLRIEQDEQNRPTAEREAESKDDIESRTPRVDVGSKRSQARFPRAGSRPPTRYGMVSPQDIGQALSAEEALTFYEDQLSLEFFGPEARELHEKEQLLQARAKRIGAPSAEDEERVNVEEQRQAAIDKVTQNTPFPADRPQCNIKGEIVTPSQRCVATTRKTHRQCKARTRDGALCWNHLKSDKGLRILPSHIAAAGRGLFAARDFPTGANITEYTGDLVVDPDDDFDSGGSRYVFGISQNVHIDAARKDTAPGRLINDPRGSDYQPNATWKVDRRQRKVRLVTTRPVRKGEEFFIRYGADFWRKYAEGAAKRRFKMKMKIAKARAVSVESSSSEFNDPKSYAEAMRSPKKDEWLKAIRLEEKSFDDLKVCTNAGAAFDKRTHRTLDTKWVFKTKRDANGNIVKFKARLVARGFRQIEGIDYDATFSSVLSYKSLRIICAIANQLDLELKVMDVETAFLNAPLEEKIFILRPEGFSTAKDPVLLVKKQLYGLKQASRGWNHYLVDVLTSIGFIQCKYSDDCIFTKSTANGRTIFIGIFVDDITYSYDLKDEKEMNSAKELMMRSFKIKDLGDAETILGMRIKRDRKQRSLTIDQETYIKRILGDYEMSKIESNTQVPELQSISLSTDRSQRIMEKMKNPAAKLTFASIPSVLGAIGYAAGATRPDISHAWNMLTREQANPTIETMIKVHQLMMYLAAYPHLGLTYRCRPEDVTIEAFSDSDWAGHSTDVLDVDAVGRRSTTGILIKLGGAAVSWSSQKQPNVAMSSSEAEYIAASEASREVRYLRLLLAEIGFAQTEPTVLAVDNQTSIRMIEEEGSLGGRRKHIDVKHHYIREQIAERFIQMKWVPTAQQEANILTKSLGKIAFANERDQMMNLSKQIKA
jgi:transposase InsO family protein